MKLQTIEKRMELAGLPIEQIHALYNLMHGIGDKSTEIGGKNNDLWVIAVISVLNWEVMEKHARNILGG